MAQNHMSEEYKSRFIKYNRDIYPDLYKIIEPLQNFQISIFAYARYYKNKTLGVCSNADFMEHWAANDLQDYASMLAALYGACDRGKIIATEKFFCTNLLGGLHQHNTFDSIAIFRKRPEYVEEVFFATHRKDIYISSFCINHMSLLDRFFSYFRDQGSRIILQAQENDILLPSQFDFGQSNEDVLENDIKALDSVLPRKTILFNRSNGKEVVLSSQESECLRCISKGQTAKTTARNLGISFRTVETYLANIKLKSDLRHKSELINLFWDNFS